MNRGRTIAILSSLVNAGLLVLAGTASAGWQGYGWGEAVAAGSTADCFAPTPSVGHSAINGNDPGQVLAFCYDEYAEEYDCGRTRWSDDFYVWAAGLPSGSSTWEFTNATTGQSVGSGTGGSNPALAWHTCEMGYFD